MSASRPRALLGVALALAVGGGLAACASDGPGFTTPDDDTGDDTTPAPDDDTSEPADGVHYLVSALPYSDPSSPSLVELDADFQAVWTWTAPAGKGTLGAVREADGSTLFVEVSFPPDLSATLRRIDASGQETFSWDGPGDAPLQFAHGVAVTPEGNYVVGDTGNFRVLALRPDGTELWRLSFDDGVGGPRAPNGVAVRDLGGGEVRLAVTLLEGAFDQVAAFRLGAEDEAPLPLFAVPEEAGEGEVSWPHGPRIEEDGGVVFCSAAYGAIVRLGPDGDEEWRLPQEEDGGMLVFPRDALFTGTGQLLIPDNAAELLVIDDPFGAFEVVEATPLSGGYWIGEVPCGPGGGPPCLGGG